MEQSAIARPSPLAPLDRIGWRATGYRHIAILDRAGLEPGVAEA